MTKNVPCPFPIWGQSGWKMNLAVKEPGVAHRHALVLNFRSCLHKNIESVSRPQVIISLWYNLFAAYPAFIWQIDLISLIHNIKFENFVYSFSHMMILLRIKWYRPMAWYHHIHEYSVHPVYKNANPRILSMEIQMHCLSLPAATAGPRTGPYLLRWYCHRSRKAHCMRHSACLLFTHGILIWTSVYI